MAYVRTVKTASGVIAAPAGLVSAEESPQQLISRL